MPIKQYLIFALSILQSLCTYSQISEIDSLKGSLNILEPDSSTIETLYSINSYFSNEMAYDSQLVYQQLLIEIGRRLEDTEAIAWGFYDRSSANWNLGDYDQALIEADSAGYYFTLASDTTRSFNSLYLAGMIHGDKGNYEQALANYYEAINGYQELKKLLHEGAVLNSVALVHQWMEDMDMAEKEFLNSIDILEKSGNKERLAMSQSNLAYLYSITDRLEESMDLQLESLKLHEEIESEWGIASNNGNIGDLLNKMGRPAEAVPYLLKNIDYQRGKDDPKELAGTLIMLGDAYIGTQEIPKAEAVYSEALQLSAESGSIDYQRLALEALVNTASVKGDHKAAFENLLKANALRDTIFNKEKIAVVSELNTRYETEKKEAQIELLDTQNELKDAALENEANTRRMLMGGLAFILLAGGSLIYGQRKKMRAERLIAAKNEELKKAEFNQSIQELELKALRAQMNPHFVFNCMNSINRLILEDENEKASRNLTKFSKLIRMILEHSEKKTISLEEELNMLRTYIDLEAQRFKGKMSYEINLAPEIDPEVLKLPSMILQPFIENAIWHGLMHKTDGNGRIELNLSEEDDYLICEVNDNGVGRKVAQELKQDASMNHKSMAMKLTEDRLALLTTEERSGSIEILDLEENGAASGTQVIVRIPL